MTRTEISVQVFNKNIKSERIKAALTTLIEANLVTQEPTKPTRYTATNCTNCTNSAADIPADTSSNSCNSFHEVVGDDLQTPMNSSNSCNSSPVDV
jgi:hypothetical protein